jgi:hypothetical protein
MRASLLLALLASIAACASARPAPADAAGGTPPARPVPRLRASPPRAASPVVVPAGAEVLAQARAVDVRVDVDGRATACRAVALATLLDRAGVFGTSAGDARYVLAVSGDGRRVLFSLAELDPRAGARRVMITRDCDGGGGAGVLHALDDATPARRLAGIDALVVVMAP